MVPECPECRGSLSFIRFNPETERAEVEGILARYRVAVKAKRGTLWKP